MNTRKQRLESSGERVVPMLDCETQSGQGKEGGQNGTDRWKGETRGLDDVKEHILWG